MIFEVDYIQLAKDLTPWFLNKPRVKQFLGSLMWGFQTLQHDFESFLSDTDFELNFDGRRIYLEKWLNRNFDPVNEQIVINTFQLPTALTLFKKSEGREQYLYLKSEAQPKKYIYHKDETGINGIVFEIVVPATITLSADIIQKIKNEVDKFSAFGKKYTIRSA